jgi:hypothetical protein
MSYLKRKLGIEELDMTLHAMERNLVRISVDIRKELETIATQLKSITEAHNKTMEIVYNNDNPKKGRNKAY